MPFHQHAEAHDKRKEHPELFEPLHRSNDDYDYYGYNYHRGYDKHEPVSYYNEEFEDEALFRNEVPKAGSFEDKLSEFDLNKPFWNQIEYEHRLSTEAELMIALEGMRDAVMRLEYELQDLL